jgi:hypothetical protein
MARVFTQIAIVLSQIVEYSVNWANWDCLDKLCNLWHSNKYSHTHKKVSIEQFWVVTLCLHFFILTCFTLPAGLFRPIILSGWKMKAIPGLEKSNPQIQNQHPRIR